MCHNIIGRSIYVSLSFVTHLKSDFLFFLQTQSLHFLCQFLFRSLSWLGKSSSKSNFSGRQLTGFGFGRPKTTTSSSCHSSAAEDALQSLDFELRSQAQRLQLNQSNASEAEEFSELASKALNSLPYDSPGQAFVAFEKPAGVPAVGKFSNTLTFVVKEVDLSTCEAEDDGVEDEYQLEDLEVVAADYMVKVSVSNFRNAWESMNEEDEHVDEYGLGERERVWEKL
ncbi:unnamed protein product [Brassica napus]|nr:unnamed protein product [Brassica napus]